MKIRALLSTTALIATLALSPAAYAEDSAQHLKQGFNQRRQQEVLNQLPPEKAKLFKETMGKTREGNQTIYEQIKQQQDALAALLTAEKFDKAAYLAKTAEIDKLYAQMRANTTQAFVSVASQFSVEERKVLAKMRRGPGKPGMKKGMNKEAAPEAAPQ